MVYPQMDKLCGRTGVRAFAFISKGHLTDVSAPGWLGSGDGLAFFPAVMKMSVEDFSAKFEHWSVTQNRRKCKINFSFCISYKKRSSTCRFSQGSTSRVYGVDNQGFE
jgi:hypothetical protein